MLPQRVFPGLSSCVRMTKKMSTVLGNVTRRDSKTSNSQDRGNWGLASDTKSIGQTLPGHRRFVPNLVIVEFFPFIRSAKGAATVVKRVPDAEGLKSCMLLCVDALHLYCGLKHIH